MCVQFFLSHRAEGGSHSALDGSMTWVNDNDMSEISCLHRAVNGICRISALSGKAGRVQPNRVQPSLSLSPGSLKQAVRVKN